MAREKFLTFGTETFSGDGRLSLEELYRLYGKLTGYYWSSEIVFQQSEKLPDGSNVFFPIPCYKSPVQGPAFWLVSGVHGEEPAGPNKIAQYIDELGKLGQEFPIVLLPLCNPLGYGKDWRYFNEYRDWHRGISVGAADHLLPDLHPLRDGTLRPYRKQPACLAAKFICEAILKISEKYPILLWINDHEDEDKQGGLPYIYSQGIMGASDPVAKEIVSLLHQNGKHALKLGGVTRYGEPIVGGIVSSQNDYSLEHFVSSDIYYKNGQFVMKPSAPTTIVVVVESQVSGFSLQERIQLRGKVYDNLRRFYYMALERQK